MADLKTNYVDDKLDTSKNQLRKYNMITNDDGTVSFVDVTTYTTQGTSFGAKDVNDTNAAINELNKNSTVQDITSHIQIIDSHFEVKSAIKIGTRCEALLYSNKGLKASTGFYDIVNLNATNQFDFTKPMYIDKWFNGRSDINKTYQVRINTNTGIVQSLAYNDETMSSSIFYYATWYED